MNSLSLIVIGASAGGISALRRLLDYLPQSLKCPIAVVQHLPANSSVSPSLIFPNPAESQAVEALDKMEIESHHIYFAPPGYHLLVERDGTFALSQDDPVNFSRPSIDVLFESAAEAYGSRTCGVLLTGANADGAVGLKAIAEKGGYTIVQDPEEAEIKTMPEAALSLIKPSFVAPLREISNKLNAFDHGDFL